MGNILNRENPIVGQAFSVLSYHKWLGFTSSVLVLISFYGLLTASPFLSLFGFLALGSIITRIHSCKSPFDISIIGAGALLLTIASGIQAGVVFGITLWFATMIWQPYAEFSYHFPNAVAAALTILFFPFLAGWSGHNLVWLAIFYGLARFVIYALILTPFLRPGTIVSDFIFNAQELPFSLLYNAFAMQLLGYLLLPLIGVGGWEAGSVFEILRSIISWF